MEYFPTYRVGLGEKTHVFKSFHVQIPQKGALGKQSQLRISPTITASLVLGVEERVECEAGVPSRNRTAGLQVPASPAFQNTDKLPKGEPQFLHLQNARAGLHTAQCKGPYLMTSQLSTHCVRLLDDPDQHIFTPLPSVLPLCCLGLFNDSRGSAEAWRNSQLLSSRCLKQRDL